MTIATIRREYTAECAHRLPHVPEGHKCRRLHGHSYRIAVLIRGEVGADGFVLDFGDVDRVAKPIVERLDHYYLNEVDGLENPTSEVLAEWFIRAIGDALPVHGVVIGETCRSECEVLASEIGARP